MKKQYVKPSTEIFEVDTDSLLEVIGLGSDKDEFDAKENDMFDDEDEDEECLNSPNLWD